MRRHFAPVPDAGAFHRFIMHAGRISAVKTFVFAASVLFASAACAQSYPSKPITFVIPFAAGGDSDLSGRNVGVHASKYLNNQPIVAINRTGASGAIGA